jgi:hypothetical protein
VVNLGCSEGNTAQDFPDKSQENIPKGIRIVKIPWRKTCTIDGIKSQSMASIIHIFGKTIVIGLIPKIELRAQSHNEKGEGGNQDEKEYFFVLEATHVF